MFFNSKGMDMGKHFASKHFTSVCLLHINPNSQAFKGKVITLEKIFPM
jgi:hypothetical protein